MTQVLSPTARGCKVKVVPGRTYVKHFDGVLIWAVVCKTPAAAQAKVEEDAGWVARQVKQYEDKGLPVPPQYGKWTHAVI